jgi:hypothetical protein
MPKLTLDDTDIDIDALLAPKPHEEDRRRLLRGFCYQLNDYEEVADE